MDTRDTRDILDALSPAGQRVIVRDLTIEASIGVYEREYEQRQTIIVNIDLFLGDPGAPARFVPDAQLTRDETVSGRVVCYDALTKAVRRLAQDGHVALVETLAEDIASLCLSDGRVATCLVRVEKPEAIEGTRSVGVEILRRQSR